MERNNEMELLGMLQRPAFFVTDGRVSRVNAGAASYHITPGMEVSSLIATGAEEYAAFEGGCLYLTLSVNDCNLGASITRLDGFDVFCLESQADSQELQSMTVIARKLRCPLETVMNTARELFPVSGLEDAPAVREQVSALNKGLMQILRVISNMSDAGENARSVSNIETVNITAVVDEIFEKAATLVAHTNQTLTFQPLPETIYCLADRSTLERAILNMVSNAVKFSKPGDVIRAALTRRGRMLYLTIADNGSGIPDDIRGDIFTRYNRKCAFEDNRFGVGLGMVLIRAAAAVHGGAVLIDQPEGSGTRVTISFPIRQSSTQVRSGTIPVEYASGHDPVLMAFSDILPDYLYENEL